MALHYISNGCVASSCLLLGCNLIDDVFNFFFSFVHVLLVEIFNDTEVVTPVVDLSAAGKESQLITVRAHLGNNSNFGFDIKHLVPVAGFVELVQKKNLLALDVHSVASEDVENQVVDLRVLPQPPLHVSENLIASLEI